jgi:response regulator of citrate/malate metabolism
MKTIIIDLAANTLIDKLIEIDPTIAICGSYTTGTEGMEAVSVSNPDTVFLSLDMPEGGLAILQNLVKTKVAIIVSSEWNTFAYDAHRLGAAAFITRPIEFEDLQIALESVQSKLKTNIKQKKNISNMTLMKEQKSTASKKTKVVVDRHQDNYNKNKIKEGHYAFLIACQNYKHYPQLHTPIEGLHALSDVLQEQFGFEIHTSIDPTHIEIKAFIDAIRDKIKKRGSKVIIFFSGHGLSRQTDNGTEGYMVPIDSTAGGNLDIPYDYLSEKLHDLSEDNCRHLLLALDCCYSGSVKHSFLTKKSIGPNFEPQDISRQIHKIFERNTSWQIIASNNEREVAFDSFSLDARFSPFTYFFLKGLKGEADANNRLKMIRAVDLFAYVRYKMATHFQNNEEQQSVGLIPMRKHQNGDFIFYLDGFDANNLADEKFKNPYKSLNVYEDSDSAIFFGRKEEQDRLTSFFQKHDLTIVTGSSGSGKSSLVRAGLIPTLKTKFAKKVFICKPAENPTIEIGIEGVDIIFVDQYEEVFDIKFTIEARDEFNKKLQEYIIEGKKIILALRNDFENSAKNNYLKQWWDEGIFRISEFSLDNILEIIFSPTGRYGFDFNPLSLRETIAGDVNRFSNSIPMLSFAMAELCDRAKEKDLWIIDEKTDYDEIGKVEGALKKKADAVFENLSDDSKVIFKNILLRMITFHEDRRMKRAVLVDEFYYIDTKYNFALVMEVLEKSLVNNRLVFSGADTMKRKYYEISHDALIHSWDKMIEWIKDAGQSDIDMVDKLNINTNSYFWLKDAIEKEIPTVERPLKYFRWYKRTNKKIKKKRLKSALWDGENLHWATQYLKKENPPIILNIRELKFIELSQKDQYKESLLRKLVRTLGLTLLISLGFLGVFAVFMKITNDKNESDRAKREKANLYATEIEQLGAKVAIVNKELSAAVGLRNMEQYDGALLKLQDIQNTVILEEAGTIYYILSEKLKDTFLIGRPVLRDSIYAKMKKIDELKVEIDQERFTCDSLKKLQILYIAFKERGDDLRNQGFSKHLDAYKQYIKASNVRYKPRTNEISGIIAANRDNLEYVCDMYIGYGDDRAKTKRIPFAIDAYQYARDIAKAIGKPTDYIDRKLAALQRQ